MILFTWGYYGWGNHTPRLIEAVDAVERSRGYAPPVFVDVRIRRAVRAKGFQGNAFEKVLGRERHRWMRSLGNRFIQTGSGPAIQIAEPAAAEELLDLAENLDRRQQRLLFFCSCQWPCTAGAVTCHRVTVAGLVLDAARNRGTPTEIVEWSGGEPRRVSLEVSPPVFRAVRGGRLSIPLGDEPNLAELAGLPWCSVLSLRQGERQLHRVVGPAIHHTTGWVLPILSQPEDPSAGPAEIEKAAADLRRGRGLNRRRNEAAG